MIGSPRLRRAAEILMEGGVLAYPTEAVWGLGCDPYCADAVFRLLELKGRDPARGLILVAADLEQLEPLLAGLPPRLLAVLERSWPGAVTWLVPDNGRAPAWIRGAHSTVALRIPAHPVARALCHLAGMPLVSTSANRCGCTPARHAFQVRRHFGRAVHLAPGVVGSRTRPSEIRELQSGEVLRRG